MSITTILGLALGFGSIIMASVLDGGSPAGLINVSAMIIIFGGTIGATCVSFPLDRVKKLPLLLKMTFFESKEDPSGLVETFVKLTEKARREGLLALEQEAGTLQDPFLKKGLLLVVDGTDAEVVRTILGTEVAAMESRHEGGHAMLEAMGGYSPTMGVIGTVVGLIGVLSKGLADPGELAASIGVAFIATLWGVMMANVIWLPMASKLKARSHKEVFMREVMIEGILSVEAGDNPRIVREKLEAYLSAGMRGSARGAEEPAPVDGKAQAGRVPLSSGS